MMKELSERVRFAMEEHNLNANSLAKLVGISRPAMIKILDGETKEPKKILDGRFSGRYSSGRSC